MGDWFPERSANFYSALSNPRGGAFHRPKWFCKQRKWFCLEMLTRLGARFYDFVVVDWFSTWYISLSGGIDSADSDPNHEISISVLETRQEEKKTAKGKYRSANNRPQNNQSSQTSIPVKRCRLAIRTKTLKCKQITAEIKTGKQQRC